MPISAVTFARDRFGPPGALQALLQKMPQAPAERIALDDAQLGTRSDHFAWMKTPVAVAAALRRQLGDAGSDDRLSQRD